jgi:uncharacterized protein YbbC (DUF1343 family)
VLSGIVISAWAPADKARAQQDSGDRSVAAPRPSGRGTVRTGADLIAERNFAGLAGMRVGLVSNHTGLVGAIHIADLIHQSGTPRLAAILAPEHGFRGTAEAGAKVAGGVDPQTGVRVLSLYGKTRKPTPAMLRGLDVLVFDIQDIGVRFYTYISTMGLAMQAAAAAGIPFIVLDRPNPLSGVYVSGFVMEAAQRSFVGQYPIPQAHGLTIGELASLIKGERLLPGLEKLELHVELARGWRRSMLWPATGLEWVAPSPNIVSFDTALAYAGTGLLEATSASDGRGTMRPFATIGAPWIDGNRLAGELGGRGLPGARFESIRFTPRAIASMASAPRHEGKSVRGVRIAITDAAAYRPVETGIHVLDALLRQSSPAGSRPKLIDQPAFLARLAGTGRLGRMLEAGAAAEAIIASWRDEVSRFDALRKRYLRYA